METFRWNSFSMWSFRVSRSKKLYWKINRSTRKNRITRRYSNRYRYVKYYTGSSWSNGLWFYGGKHGIRSWWKNNTTYRVCYSRRVNPSFSLCFWWCKNARRYFEFNANGKNSCCFTSISVFCQFTLYLNSNITNNWWCNSKFCYVRRYNYCRTQSNNWFCRKTGYWTNTTRRIA